MQPNNLDNPQVPPPSHSDFLPPSPAPNIVRERLVATALTIALVVVGVAIYFALPGSKTQSNGQASVANASLANSPSVSPASVVITAKGFEPDSIVINPNQAVVWTNDDTSSHSLSASSASLQSFDTNQSVIPNSSYSYIFSKPGTYAYHDPSQADLSGTVIVK